MNSISTRVTSSLLSAATLLCADDFQNQHHAFKINIASKSIISGVYVTKEGKIAIECCDHEAVQRLIQGLGIDANIELAQIQKQLSNILLNKTAEEWITVLQYVHVPAAVVAENLADLHSNACLKSMFNPGTYAQVNSPWSFQ